MNLCIVNVLNVELFNYTYEMNINKNILQTSIEPRLYLDITPDSCSYNQSINFISRHIQTIIKHIHVIIK